jgi:tetratricopeptide (TPR) repeat protein
MNTESGEAGGGAPSRLETLKRMAASRPDDARTRFGLALEYERVGAWREAAAELRQYLETAEDEGNAWGRLGRALRELGRHEEAREAYRRGVEVAEQHGHPTMAAEFEELLEAWED